MSRRARPHQPGSTFHLTTRLHRSEALFTPEVRTGLVGIIRDQLVFSDVDLLAYAIMPNHVHLVVRQGRQPLHRFMQPIIRRAALLVQRVHGREGHVFERRYRDRPCADPEHLRNAVVYTHLNPVRAGLCGQPDEYAWTSHGAWLGAVHACDGRRDPAAVEQGLSLFATCDARRPADLVEDYLAFLKWRVDLDAFRTRADAGEMLAGSSPEPPAVGHGDANWMHLMTPRPPSSGSADRMPRLPSNGGPVRADLSEIARTVMSDAGPGLELALLRSRWGGRPYIRARHAFIRSAAAAGYRGVQIATYLHITTTAVSRVLSLDRKRLLGRAA